MTSSYNRLRWWMMTFSLRKRTLLNCNLKPTTLRVSKDGVQEEVLIRRRLIPTVLLIGSIVLCFSYLAETQQGPKPELHASREISGAIENIKVHSAALEKNKLGDPADQDVAVYLPTSYRSSGPSAIRVFIYYMALTAIFVLGPPMATKK